MNQYLHKCDGYFHKYHKLPLDSPVCGTLQFKICNLRFICKNIASQTWTNICTHVMDISINIINYPQTAQRLWQSAEHYNMQKCILRLLCTNIASFDITMFASFQGSLFYVSVSRFFGIRKETNI